jgi:transposase-like protein
MKRKDLRRRNLRFLSAGVANLLVVMSRSVVLVRWQCTSCKFTFTDYPDFRPTL